MLGLINRDRASVGLPPVVLGTNPAAQRHAEEMLAKGYLSHWGTDGMKPYMRYTLAGGVNYEAENVAGARHFVDESQFEPQDTRRLLEQVERAFMGSAGHRANILNKWHKRVNLGVAWNRATVSVVQQFEGDYVAFDAAPTIEGGVLSLAGRTTGGFAFARLEVWYDPLPQPLTVGQLSQTECYDSGTPVAFVRPPAEYGYQYTETSLTYAWEACPSPYAVPADTPPPTASTPPTARPREMRTATVPWVDARRWLAIADGFAVEVDLGRVIASRGPGVYTVVMYGRSGAELKNLTNYAVWVR